MVPIVSVSWYSMFQKIHLIRAKTAVGLVEGSGRLMHFINRVIQNRSVKC